MKLFKRLHLPRSRSEHTGMFGRKKKDKKRESSVSSSSSDSGKRRAGSAEKVCVRSIDASKGRDNRGAHKTGTQAIAPSHSQTIVGYLRHAKTLFRS